MRRLAHIAAIASLIAGVVVVPAVVSAEPTKPSAGTSARSAGGKSARTASKARSASSTRSKSTKKKKRRVAMFSGHNAPRSSLRTEPLERPSGELWLRAENLGQEARVNIYKPDGSFDEAALAQLDELFRCVKTGEVRAVRAELYEQLSRMYDHFGKPISLVSGFRFAERDSSRHFHASAADFRIKDVSIQEIYRYAESLDAGGMGIGIYPTSQFVHLDYRAPGEPSFRWTDYSGSGSGRKATKKKSPGRTQPARKPTS